MPGNIDISSGLVPSNPQTPPAGKIDLSSGLVPAPQPAVQELATTQPQSSMMGDLIGGSAKGASDAVVGAGKELLGQAEGAATLGGKAIQALAPAGTQVPIPKFVPPKASGLSEELGGQLTDIGEWAAGDSAMEGLLKLAATPEWVLQMAEKYPTAAQFLQKGAEGAQKTRAVRMAESGAQIAKGGAKGALIGGTQGTLEGAPEGNAIKEGEGGAMGGAIAGMLGEAAPEIAGEVGRATKTGGMKPEEYLEIALRPHANEPNFKSNSKEVLPRMAEQYKTGQYKKDPAGFAQAAHDAKVKLWETEIQPQIEKHPFDTVSGDDIADKVKTSVDQEVRKHYPEAAAKIDQWADTFKGPIPIDRVNAKLKLFNAQLRGFYSGSESQQLSQALSNPELGMLDSAADALRDALEQKLTAAGETDHMNLRRQYGQLNQLQRVAEKRAVVYGRQNPINLSEVVGATTAAATGHPAAALVAPAIKVSQGPERMIGKAIEDVAPGKMTKVKNIAGKTAKALGGSAATQIGEQSTQEPGTPISEAEPEWVPVKTADGQTLEVHPEDLEEMQKRDPSIQVASPTAA